LAISVTVPAAVAAAAASTPPMLLARQGLAARHTTICWQRQQPGHLAVMVAQAVQMRFFSQAAAAAAGIQVPAARQRVPAARAAVLAQVVAAARAARTATTPARVAQAARVMYASSQGDKKTQQ